MQVTLGYSGRVLCQSRHSVSQGRKLHARIGDLGVLKAGLLCQPRSKLVFCVSPVTDQMAGLSQNTYT